MQKNVKRTLSVALAGALAVGCAVPAYAESSVPDYSGHWVEAYMQAFVDDGYLQGYGDNVYMPDQEITRAEMMTLINRVSGLTDKADEATVAAYTDVEAGSWYYDEVAIALEAGYVDGKSPTSMAPDDTITREETMTMIGRMIYGTDYEYTGEDVLAEYTDSGTIADYAEDYVSVLIASEVVDGYPDQTLRPQGYLTRAEAVKMLYYVMDDLRVDTNYIYATMNVPYADYFEAATDADEYVDVVAQATTSKMAGTTGLAKGTYNNLEYEYDEEGNATLTTVAEDAKILGVTCTVAMTEATYNKIKDLATSSTEDYYFTLLETEEAPSTYLVVSYNTQSGYSFTSVSETVEVEGVTVGEASTSSSYGDYMLELEGVLTDGGCTIGEETYTIYAAVLEDSNGNTYGMVCMENMWWGTRVENLEIAFSVTGGANKSGHGGVAFHQFSESLNGATLTSVTLYTDKGTIAIPCAVSLAPYYTGEVTVEHTIGTTALQINGLPEGEATVSVSYTVGSGRTATTVYLAQDYVTSDGSVVLDTATEDGVQYTVTVSLDGYAPITTTFGDASMTDEQRATLESLIAEAEALLEQVEHASLEEHVAEAKELLANEDATYSEAAELIEELETFIAEAEALLPAGDTTYTGTLTGTAVTYPDDDEDFDAYSITVTVVVESNLITEVTMTGATGDNATYANKALNGTSKKTGLATQLAGQNITETLAVDAVSGATCSSTAILEAVQNAVSTAGN